MTALLPNDRFISLSPAAGTTVLAYDFELMLAEGMAVTLVRAGVSTLLTLGIDYSFPSGIGDNTGGTLTLGVASLAGDVYLLVGAQPEQRLSDFQASQRFAVVKMNADLDALTMIAQEHRRDIGRAWKSAYGTAGGQIAAGVAGQVPAFDDHGNLVPMTPDAATLASVGLPAAPGADTFLQRNGADTNWISRTAAQVRLSIIPGFASLWLTILQTTTAPLAWLALKVMGYTTTRAEMKAIVPVAGMAVKMGEGDRSGDFDCLLLSSLPAAEQTAAAADTLEGVYVISTANPLYVWKRRWNDALEDVWFGSARNSGTDSQPAIMAAYNLLVTIDGATEGSIGKIRCSKGYRTLASSVAFSKPVDFEVANYLRYTPTTGSVLIISETAPVAGRNTGYNIRIGGLRAVNGNLAAPTGINAAGCSGIEIRNMQFSNIQVGRIIAFTKYGLWGNQSNNVYTGQHCQDNHIRLGDVAFCGLGLMIESVSGVTGAFQVNDVRVQNSFGNWQNFRVGAAGDNNSNNNFFVFNAMDADSGGGAGFVRGLFNDFQFGYANGTIAFEAGSAYNRAYAQVGKAQLTFTNAGTKNDLANAVEGRLTPQWWETTDISSPPINLASTSNNTSFAELLALRRRNPSAAANNGGVGIGAYFWNDAQAEILGGRIRTDMPTVAAAGSNYNLRWLFDTIVGGVLSNKMTVWMGLVVGTGQDQGAGTVNVDTKYCVANKQVVGAQAAGWTGGTGAALKGTWAAYAGQAHTAAYVQATIQTLDDNCKNTSQRVKAIEDALRTHGLIN